MLNMETVKAKGRLFGLKRLSQGCQAYQHGRGVRTPGDCGKVQRSCPALAQSSGKAGLKRIHETSFSIFAFLPELYHTYFNKEKKFKNNRRISC
jgi:hypothetical protein